MQIKIFEVQSAALADGVYNCYEQKLLASAWESGHGDKFSNIDGAVNVEVFNLQENDTVSSYEPALATGDKIAAWALKDENGNSRWVGVPLVPSTRMVRTTEAAPAGTNITCNLIGNDGETELTSGLGAGVEVYCSTALGVDLNAATPRLADDDYLFAENISGAWRCVAVFSAVREDCACGS